MSDAVSVRYVQGRAEAWIGEVTLFAQQRDEPGGYCPLELLTAALGS